VTAPRLELRGVGHAYGGRVVLADVDYALAPGRSLGLLGPNGSGKSTLLRCIAGLLRPRAGAVLVDGHESCELPPAKRALIAYAGHRPVLWGGLSARENLVLCAGLYGLAAERAEAALAAADLAEPAGGLALAGAAAAPRARPRAPALARPARAGRAPQRA
jgi:ABC-type multidrug transport system ATPase subunit